MENPTAKTGVTPETVVNTTPVAETTAPPATVPDVAAAEGNAATASEPQVQKVAAGTEEPIVQQKPVVYTPAIKAVDLAEIAKDLKCNESSALSVLKSYIDKRYRERQ